MTAIDSIPWTAIVWTTVLLSARILPIALIVPCFGCRFAPPSARVALVVTICMAVASVLVVMVLAFYASASEDIFDFSTDMPWMTWRESSGRWPGLIRSMSVRLLSELSLGLAIGLVATLVFEGMEAGFHTVLATIGGGTHGFRRVHSLPVLGSLIGVVVFVGIDGHLQLLDALVHSYRILPLGRSWTEPLTAAWNVDVVVDASARMFDVAVRVASPVLVSSVLVQSSTGVFERVVPGSTGPRMGAPIAALIGLLFLAISMTAMAVFLARSFTSTSRMLQEIPAPL